jgi:hypothetical protein
MFVAALPETPVLAWQDAAMRVLLLRLSPWQDVQGSTPHLFLHHELARACPQAYLDFAFFPDAQQRELLEGDPARSWIEGLTSGRAARDFDLLLISNSCGVELINLPLLLQKSGLAVDSGQRSEADPAIWVGGSNLMAAQALIREDGDCMADLLFFGEGEARIGAAVNTFFADPRLTRKERHVRIADLQDGFWPAGDRSRKVRKAVYRQPSGEALPMDHPVFDGPGADTARLQLTFGCPCFCSFCFEGYDRKPYREVALEELLVVARQLKFRHGASCLELYSFNFNSHRSIVPLLGQLHSWFDQVSVKSQRVDFLQQVSGLMDVEFLIDKRSFTLGIEGISQGTRALLNKSLTLAQIRACVEALVVRKARQLKLFYVLSGFESEADVAEFADFCKWLKALLKSKASGVRVIFSCGYLVRMPFTPLRHAPLMLDAAEWEKLSKKVRAACTSQGFEFRIAADWDDYFFSQVVAMGGYWLHDALVDLVAKGHFYDGVIRKGVAADLEAWMQARECLSPEWLGEKDQAHPFALEFVEGGVSEGFLFRQYEAQRQGRDTGFCLSGKCQACEACDQASEQSFLTKHHIKTESREWIQQLQDRTRLKRQLKPVFLTLRLPAIAAWCSAEWVGAYAMRTLLEKLPAQWENLLVLRESLFSHLELRSQWAGLAGETVFGAKVWDRDAWLQALANLNAEQATAIGLGLVPGDWQEGTFRRARLRLRLTKVDHRQVIERLSAFLEKSYCPARQLRRGDHLIFEVSEKALKKKVLFEGTLTSGGAESLLEWSVGPRFDPRQWVRLFPEAWSKGRPPVVEVDDLQL